MNMLQANSAGDISLDAVAVMAQANGESTRCVGDHFKIVPTDAGWDCLANKSDSCCPLG
jgi:hypothetical protein